jgi:hypothetical protein
MNDEALRTAYREILARRPTGRGRCPPVEAIGALVERRGTELERLATLDHVMNCAECKSEFDLMQAMTPGRPVPAQHLTTPIAMAAGIALAVSGTLLFAALRARNPEDTGVRGATNGVELISPRGDFHVRPITFTWRKAGGSARYSLEVFTPAGDAVYNAEVADTFAVLPANVSLEAGTTYHWWVLVRTSDGAEVRTPPVAFTP